MEFQRTASVGDLEEAQNAIHHRENSGGSLGSCRRLAEGARDVGGQVFDHPSPPARRRWKKGEDHAIGRSRGGLSTKIHALVDENSLPVQLVLTAGQAEDLRAAPQLLKGLECRHAVADRGYCANALLDLIWASGAKSPHPCNPPADRPLRGQQGHLQTAQPRRTLLCKLKHFGRIAIRFDKLARNFLAAVA